MTIAVAAAGSGCSPRVDPDPDVVAHVDGRPVTSEDLRAQVDRDRRSPGSDRGSRGGRRRLLDRTIDDLLLLREARRRGIRVTYGDLDHVRQRHAKRLLAAELEPTLRLVDIPEEEIRAEYERTRSSLGNPEMRRVEIARARSRPAAVALLGRAIDAGDDVDEISAIIREGSEGPRGGASVRYGGFFPYDEAVRYVGEGVAQAAFALPEGEHVCPEPLPFRGAWAVVAVTNRAAPRAVSYEDAAPQIRQRLFGRHRDRALDRFVAGFRDDYEVVVHEEHMDLVDWMDTRASVARPDAGPPSQPPPPSAQSGP